MQNNKTFDLKCSIDNQGTLTISIPQRLYKEFEGRIQNNDMNILCEIFDAFSKMPSNQRRRFQNKLFIENSRIKTLEDVLFLIWQVRME